MSSLQLKTLPIWERFICGFGLSYFDTVGFYLTGLTKERRIRFRRDNDVGNLRFL
jgi:hypothetical protein